jgi:hypothetical protein
MKRRPFGLLAPRYDLQKPSISYARNPAKVYEEYSGMVLHWIYTNAWHLVFLAPALKIAVVKSGTGKYLG